MSPRPHLREAGSGPAVVCLHCNASSGAQWASLTQLLAARHRVLAPDLWGADVRTRLFPGLGHMGAVEQPAIVNAAIERYIHQLPERRNP